MQNNFLQIDRDSFDKELCFTDAYGKSLIICNFYTYSLLIEEFDLDEKKLLEKDYLNYKGHEVYICPNYKDFEYRIFPKHISTKRLKNLRIFRRIESMEKRRLYIMNSRENDINKIRKEAKKINPFDRIAVKDFMKKINYPFVEDEYD